MADKARRSVPAMLVGAAPSAPGIARDRVTNSMMQVDAGDADAAARSRTGPARSVFPRIAAGPCGSPPGLSGGRPRCRPRCAAAPRAKSGPAARSGAGNAPRPGRQGLARTLTREYAATGTTCSVSSPGIGRHEPRRAAPPTPPGRPKGSRERVVKALSATIRARRARWRAARPRRGRLRRRQRLFINGGQSAASRYPRAVADPGR